MVDRPTEDFEWAEDPNATADEPSAIRAEGWQFEDVPTAGQKNWLQRMVGRWLDYFYRTGGGGFDEPAEAADTLDIRGTAPIVVPSEIPLSRELDDLLDPLDLGVENPDGVDDTIAIGRVPVSDGRRVFINEIVNFESPPLYRVAGFEVHDGEIQRVVDTGTFDGGMAVMATDTDGHSLAIITEETGPDPDDNRELLVYDAGGDLSTPRWAYEHGSTTEDFTARHVVCYGEWIVWVRMLDEVGSGARFFVEGFAADQTGAIAAPDWSLEINAAGDLESTEEYVCSGVASNGEFLAVHIHGDTNNSVDVTGDSFVFLLDANGETPNIDVDQPDVVGVFDADPSGGPRPPMTHSDFRTVVWNGNRCYVGTRWESRGIFSFHFQHVPDYNDYSALIKPEFDLFWRSNTFDPAGGTGGVQAFLSTDGDQLMFSAGDDLESLHYRVLCDLRATVGANVPSADEDFEPVIRTMMIFEADPGDDWDERVDSHVALDGLYGWSVAGSVDEGDPQAPATTLRALSTGRQSRQMARTDPTDPFNRPFHGVLIPTQ